MVKISGDMYIYDGNIYDYNAFLKEVKLIKYAVLLILNQNIYIRKLECDIKNMTEEDINNIRESEFGKDEEYLIHYEVRKKEKCLYMYAVSGGKKIAHISKYFKELDIIPIQFYIKKKLVHKIKDKSYQCLFFYMGIYYFFSVNRECIVRSCVFKELYEVREFINKLNTRINFYVQQDIKLKMDKAIFIDLGDIYDEKILS